MSERTLQQIQADLAGMATIKSMLNSHYPIELGPWSDNYGYKSDDRLTLFIGGEQSNKVVSYATQRQLRALFLETFVIDQDLADLIHERVNARVKAFEDELIVKAKDLAKSGGR